MRFQSSIESGGRTLRGIIHLPDEGDPKAVVCMFPGLDGTKVGPHRLFVQLSEALEAEDVASVRYDLTGQGDSDGRYADITPRIFQQDLETILTSIREDERTAGLQIMTLGYSLGGILAATAAGLQPQQVTGVIMLSPVLNYPQLRDQLNANIPVGGVVDFNGNVSYKHPPDQTWSHDDVIESLESVRTPMLMVTGNRDSMVPREIYRTFMGSVLKGKCVHLEIDGSGHSFSSGPWTKVLITAICNFVAHRPLTTKRG